jgi:hypothetical protein
MRPHANTRYTGPIPPEHITRRYRRLPHWEAPHRIIFITFRLCDSLPGGMVKLLRQQLSWLQSQPPASVNSSGIDPETVFGSSIAKLLDRNYGSCVLRDPAIARLVEAELLSGDGSQYLLGDFVIMPNHVHTLIEPLGDSRLSDILRSWKRQIGAPDQSTTEPGRTNMDARILRPSCTQLRSPVEIPGLYSTESSNGRFIAGRIHSRLWLCQLAAGGGLAVSGMSCGWERGKTPRYRGGRAKARVTLGNGLKPALQRAKARLTSGDVARCIPRSFHSQTNRERSL